MVSREQRLGSLQESQQGSHSAILEPKLVPRAQAEGGEILYGGRGDRVGEGYVGGNIVCDMQGSNLHPSGLWDNAPTN